MSTDNKTILDLFHWRELRIPAEVFLLYLDEVLTQTEMLCLSLIDAMVDIRGEGCWVSNGLLAKTLRMKDPGKISDMVGKFIRLGLVKRTGTKRVEGRDQRVIETVWSRIREIVNDSTVGFKDQGAWSSKTNNSSSLRSVEIKQHTAAPLARRRQSVDVGDKIYGEQLREIVRKNYPLDSKHHRAHQYHEMFHALRKKVSDQDIEEVLAFLQKHGREKYTPMVRTANTFRDKFRRIQEAITRQKESAPSKVRLDVEEISDEAKKLHSDIKDLGWGKNSKDLLQAIHLTYETYRDFLKRLKSYITRRAEKLGAKRSDDYEPFRIKGKPVPSDLQFADRLYRDTQSPNSFTRGWFTEVHQYADQPKWEGKILNLALKVDSERFTKYLEIRSDEWTSLKEKLYAE